MYQRDRETQDFLISDLHGRLIDLQRRCAWDHVVMCVTLWWWYSVGVVQFVAAGVLRAACIISGEMLLFEIVFVVCLTRVKLLPEVLVYPVLGLF